MDEQTLSAAPSIFATFPLSFESDRREFRRLVMRGALIELVTAGFYRFWLATDIRRHIWRSLSAGGDSAEYTGTGKELLLGALLALAIFAPLYVVYFLIGVEAERAKTLASAPFGLFFYLFAQFAIYRARRYRLTRTIWRGVRFWMTGSGWDYAWRAALWALGTFVTLGLLLPWREAALERFKMRHSYYGNLQGAFEGKGEQFFARGFGLWLVIVLVFAAMVLVGAAHPGLRGLLMLGLVVGLPFIYAAFKAIEWRWWVSGIRFGDVGFKCELRGGDLMGLYWKVIGWSFLLLIFMFGWFIAVGFLGAWALHIQGATQQEIAQAAHHPVILTGIIVGYVIGALMMTTVLRIYLLRDVAERIANST
ncbi:MAG TPA: DUF898 family protein, partial [Xanthobacteraceae bacterium]|nr:DUF898 family protein [Xanthobacteraceae bacterium]